MKDRKKSLDLRKMTVVGVLGAISILLGMTPLGFIPIGPTKATIMHIPVIIGAIMEGPVVGALVGLIFGLFSIFQAMTNPTPISFVFLNPIISILPRVLIGIGSYYTYKMVRELGDKKAGYILKGIFVLISLYLVYGIYSSLIVEVNLLSALMNAILLLVSFFMAYYADKKNKNRLLDVTLSSIVGSLINTVGVLSLVYFLYGDQFVEKLGGDITMARKVILGIGITNGIPEAILGVIIVSSVVGALKTRK